MRHLFLHTALCCLLLLLLSTGPASAQRLKIQNREGDQGKISHGTFQVPENRSQPDGRMLELEFVILHATGENPRPDPLFFFAGGPGQAAATMWRRFTGAWEREQRDIVLINQRGTGGSNRLDVKLPGDGRRLQTYLEPLFDEQLVRQSLAELQERFDLRMYSTPAAMDDVNEFRQTMGYDKINLLGGSYGTRASLIYIRRHGETVRTATLNGVAPLAFTNPLYHAREAQAALDKILQEVEADPTCREAFPRLRDRFQEILTRLDERPAEVELQIVGTDEKQTVRVNRRAFVDALRLQMYSLPTSRKVPWMLHQAHQGDFKPLVISAIQTNRALRQTIALGMLLCVTAAEDVARIDPSSVPCTDSRHVRGRQPRSHANEDVPVLAQVGAPRRFRPASAVRRAHIDIVGDHRPGDLSAIWRGGARQLPQQPACGRAGRARCRRPLH